VASGEEGTSVLVGDWKLGLLFGCGDEDHGDVPAGWSESLGKDE